MNMSNFKLTAMDKMYICGNIYYKIFYNLNLKFYIKKQKMHILSIL